MAKDYFFGDDFEAAVRAAGAEARLETLKAGIPVFYMQEKMNIMEQPDGRKFEIRFIPGAPRERNYEVLRELNKNAA